MQCKSGVSKQRFGPSFEAGGEDHTPSSPCNLSFDVSWYKPPTEEFRGQKADGKNIREMSDSTSCSEGDCLFAEVCGKAGGHDLISDEVFYKGVLSTKFSIKFDHISNGKVFVS